MISKYMRGRLGNQLFQFAAIRYIQKVNNKENEKIYLNFSKYIYSKGFEDELKYFNVKPYIETEKVNASLIQKIMIIIFKVIKRIIRFVCPKEYYVLRYKLEDKYSKFLIKNGIYWKEDGALNIIPTNKKNKIVIGHYESKKNFDKIRDELLIEFEPKELPLDKNKELYKSIKNSNSVCISIRRGDFVTNEKFSKKYNVCDINYFVKAIELIKEKVENPVFVIFSDDVEWCKENLKFDGTVLSEDGTDPVWEKLRLMYSCKHFIISNSTFSWWAQYLSRNKNKVVVAPARWNNSGYKSDIYDENWYLINN